MSAAPLPPPARCLAPRERALVVGAGGVLGSALLAEALVAGRFAQVAALVAAPLAATLEGFAALPEAALDAPAAPVADIAFVVLERDRHANGRDDAFVRPDPAQLPALAARLQAAGVRRLVVVVPHAPALLPAALAQGFASQTEHAVAALDFEHCVFLRAAQGATPEAGRSGVERLVGWWLSQLRWMIPAPQAAVRTVRLAQLVVAIGRLLPATAPGTRVLAPEQLADAAREPDENQAEIKLAAALARR
ncbi:Rossmann-fold NAD(P)-binding domain-containing protein [Rubrivivax gelatinosus]|uniref:Uncharacterized protein n=1 Tax=Rubrivivax gelatinosus TaxID=28068 RepID=A0A4R2LYV8_RUBGE|nr:hypothetical protein [Rubrivivax gelatinosus]MBK1690246.1 hypothetical protein [Rubrivivax gelatinosus]TCO98820.1 hypothetical protein EV684_11681 [Rubrivivax gelatinosus]